MLRNSSNKNTFTRRHQSTIANRCTRKQQPYRHRRSRRLQYGGYPNAQRDRYKKRVGDASLRRHNKKLAGDTSLRRHNKKLAGDASLRRHSQFGLQWDRQSCWMDASMMAMFYPEAMYNILYPMFESNTDNHLVDVRQTICHTISEMRSPEGVPHLHGLRSMLTDFTNTRDQKYAFQVENQMGYVFYFLQEILRLFGADCTRALAPHRKNYSKLYVMEMEFCNNNSVEQCLASTYKGWSFDDNIAKYMIIELIDEDGKYSVRPQERIEFVDYEWTLCSMVVFDCSHFVSYVKEGEKWFLYDDTRSLSHQALDPYDFGSYYNKGSCQFQYGKQNTFFFYTRP